MTFPVAPIKTLGDVRVSNVDKHTVEGHVTVRLCNYVDVYKNETVDDGMDFMAATATPDQIRAFRLRAGDTVFTKDSETADDIGIPAYIASAGDDLVCGYHLAIFRPHPGRIVPRFAFWAMKSRPVLARWETTATGVTRVGLKSSDIRKVALSVPPLTEQRAIADYLDRETAKIDTLIEKQTTMIARLQERRIALLWSAVTGRSEQFRYDRRPAAPWAADIPSSWILVPLRALLKERGEVNRRLQSTAYLSLMARRGVIPYADKGDVGNKAPEDLSRCKIVHVDDFVLNSMNYQIGSYGVSQYAGVCSPAYLVLHATGRGDPRFIHAILSCSAFQQYAQNLGDGILAHRRAITWSDLMVQMVPFPSLDEQHEIADYLDRETAKIDTLIAKVERHIELAKERRAALITAAVTGQIDVTARAA